MHCEITLIPQQKLQLKEMYDSTRDGRVRDFIKAVLLASEGWSQPMIVEALGIHKSTVTRTAFYLKNLSLKMVEAKVSFLLSKPCTESSI